MRQHQCLELQGVTRVTTLQHGDTLSNISYYGNTGIHDVHRRGERRGTDVGARRSGDRHVVIGPQQLLMLHIYDISASNLLLSPVNRSKRRRVFRLAQFAQQQVVQRLLVLTCEKESAVALLRHGFCFLCPKILVGSGRASFSQQACDGSLSSTKKTIRA